MSNDPVYKKDETTFSPEESLQLIQSMISKTKGAVADDSFYFLMWGWLVFSCCLGEFILKLYFQYPYHYAVWWLMPLGGVISVIYGSRQSKIQQMKTFVEESVDFLWIGLALAFVALVSINIASDQWQHAFTYFILLYAIGTFITGKLIRFRPLVTGGLINFVLAIIASKYNFDYQLLIGALAILISYIIPGHLLRSRYQKQKRLS